MKQMIGEVSYAKAASHPARGAWIETLIALMPALTSLVAPRAGCVD